MSQFDFGTIDPNSKSGAQLALDLNKFRDALNSGHKGSVRPSYAQAGMQWVRETSSTQWDLMFFDGDTDFVLRSVNPTTNALLGIPQNQIEGLIATLSDLDSKYVGKDSATGAATLPSGTTAQRPATPVAGMVRLNTTTGKHERYAGGKWLTHGDMDGPLNEAVVSALDSASASIAYLYNNTITISGSSTITTLGASAASGIVRRLVFTSALQLTHNAAALILPGAANIVTGDGDVAEFVSLGAGKWKCLSFVRGADRPNGKGQCTSWVNFDGSGTVAIRDSFNVLSITDRGVGRYTVNFEQAMVNANYSISALSGLSSGTNRTVVTPFAVDPTATPENPLVGSFKIAIGEVGSGTAADAARISLQVFGGK